MKNEKIYKDKEGKRLRLVRRMEIKSLGRNSLKFILEIYEPFAQARQNNDPDASYSAKVWKSNELWHPYKIYEKLNRKEAFYILPTYIMEQWGYNKFNYIHTLQEAGVYGYSKHPWQIRKEEGISIHDTL